MKPLTVLVCGPHREAVSGVSTHVNLLMESTLAEDFDLAHFQVGSEGRDEGRLGRWIRLAASPIALFFTIVFRHVDVLHLNTSLNPRAYWRDVAYLLVAKLLRARVLYQVHGGALPQDFFAGKRLRTAFLRWTLGLPDLVVVLASVELAAYRVVQEALTNTMRHAAGASAVVIVRYAKDGLRIEVTDTGGSPSPSGEGGTGRGLIGLRERLAVYGGTLTTGRRLTGGYRLEAVIPMETS